jgi:hypothetical protein
MVAVVGCGGRGSPVAGANDSDSSRPTEDTAWMSYPSTQPTPSLSLDDVSATLTEVAGYGSVNTLDIAYAFQAVMEHGGDACPSGVALSFSLVLGCTTQEGWTYAGIAWLDVTEADPISGAPLTYYLGGDFEIQDPDGGSFEGGGETTVTTTRSDGRLESEISYKGTWRDDSDKGWLGRGISGVFEATVVNSDDEHLATLDGGLAIGDKVMNFDNTVFDDLDCPSGLKGTIGVRDDQGYWYEWRLGDDCDECGDVVFHGEQEMGELCLDVSQWANATYVSWLPH